MSTPKTTLSLRFIGENLDPAEISRALGCKPSEAVRKGDTLLVNGSPTKAPTGVWRLKLAADDRGTFDDKVGTLLGLVSDDPKAWAFVTASYRCELFVGVFLTTANEGLRISASTMERLSRRGVQIEFDIYCALRGK
jgi:hypothetical protein